MFRANHRIAWIVFGLAFAAAFLWAGFTGHVWEDYYITYRSSKNLATGHGLVFNPGERLHTFTSPLGVLLPAAASVLTGNSSDVGAIWIFRLWSAAAFAGAAVLVHAVARHQGHGRGPTVAVLAFVILDAKSLDFTINGMETGILLFFIGYTWWAMFGGGRWRGWHLGLAWAGLMWTRPDSFLYVGLLAGGVFLFNDPARTGLTRDEWLKRFVQAGALCTLLYLPWFLWAWWYFGSPVPHTIIAKGFVSASNAKTLLGALNTLLSFPWTVWAGRTSLESAFLPSYFQIGGWPATAVTVARWIGLVLAFQWVLPWRVEVRAASFAFCGMHVYLSYYPFFPFPWYLPGTALLAALTAGGMIAQLLAAGERGVKRFGPGMRAWPVGILGAASALIMAEGWLSWQMMREMKVEQEFSATGSRRKVGEWLHEQARPGDNVFMEPLGHIGYFSGLKTYDFPGLSSREMVRAIRIVGPDWAALVDYLCPDWMVLRPFEIARMRQRALRVVSEIYEVAAEFNTLDSIRAHEIYGRNYVEHDAHLIVFRRVKPKRLRLDISRWQNEANHPVPIEWLGPDPVFRLHATGLMSIKVPPGARHVSFRFGLHPGAYEGKIVTDGVGFRAMYVADDDRSHQLFDIYVDPVNNEQHRMLQTFEADLIPALNGELVLVSSAGPSDVMDWSCWGVPVFKF